jgi:hypothetical protein
VIHAAGTRPEIELFDSGDILLMHDLVADGTLKGPHLASLVLGVKYGFRRSCRPSWRVERVVGGAISRSGNCADRRGSIAPPRSRPRSECRRRCIGGVLAADLQHAARDHRALAQVEDGSTMQNSSPPVRASMSPGRSRVCAIRVKCCRQASPAAWPWVSLISLKPSRSITSSANGSPLRSDRAFLGQPLQQMAAVGDAGEIVEQREIGDLVAQPVHRHQQEAEIPRHRQEHQQQDQRRLERVERRKREIAADAAGAAGADRVDRDDQ